MSKIIQTQVFTSDLIDPDQTKSEPLDPAIDLSQTIPILESSHKHPTEFLNLSKSLKNKYINLSDSLVDLSNPVDSPNQKIIKNSKPLVFSKPINNFNTTSLDERKDIGNSLDIGYSSINVLTKAQSSVKPITVLDVQTEIAQSIIKKEISEIPFQPLTKSMVIKDLQTNITSFKHETQLARSINTTDSSQTFISTLSCKSNLPSKSIGSKLIPRENSKENSTNNNQEEIPKLSIYSFITYKQLQLDKLKVLNIEYPNLKVESYTEETWLSSKYKGQTEETWIFNKLKRESQIQRISEKSDLSKLTRSQIDIPRPIKRNQKN